MRSQEAVAFVLQTCGRHIDIRSGGTDEKMKV